MLPFMRTAISKYNYLSLAAKAAIWFTICNFILKGINFVSTPIFAALLEPSEYGILSVYVSYEQIILILSTWEIPLSSYQKGLLNYKDNIPFFTKSSVIFANIISTVFFAFVIIFYKWISFFTGFSQENLIFLYIYMLLWPAFNCWIVLKRSQFDYKRAIIVTILNALISVLLPMIAVHMISRTAGTKFNFTLIGSSFIFVFFYFQIIREGGSLSDTNLIKKQWRYIALFQIPLVIHSLSYAILVQADRVMISKMVGSAEAAYYSVSYNIAQVIGIVQTSLMQALIPWILSKLDNKDYKEIQKTSGLLLVIVASAVALFVFVSPEVIKLLFSEDYYEAVWSMPPVTISVYFMFLNALFVWVENYYEKTQYVAIASVICAAINIVLNYFAIGIFGYIACGYTTLISYILFALLHYCFVLKIKRDNCINEKIYDLKQNMAISIILIGVMIVAAFTYDYVLIRYLIIIAILFGIMIYRDRIITLFTKIRNKQ